MSSCKPFSVLLWALLGLIAACCSNPTTESEECVCECDCSPSLSEEEACEMAMQHKEAALTPGDRYGSWRERVGCTNYKSFSDEGRAEIDVEWTEWVAFERKGLRNKTTTIRLLRSDQGWYIP